MAASDRLKRIEGLMEEAEAAMRRNHWFQAESHAAKALQTARQGEEWALMARIVLPLQEARRQRLAPALESRKVTILDQPLPEAIKASKGCVLVQPPLVGADARRLRLAAMAQEVSVAVLCREPLTRMRQCPVVAIGAATVRTKLAPPKVWEKPTMEWFVSAMEELGDAAIQMVDTGVDLDRQIDQVLAYLDAVPDHEKLHQLLSEMCLRASKGFERRMPARIFEDLEDAGGGEGAVAVPKEDGEQDGEGAGGDAPAPAAEGSDDAPQGGVKSTPAPRGDRRRAGGSRRS